jgi:hypothetical protein
VWIEKEALSSGTRTPRWQGWGWIHSLGTVPWLPWALMGQVALALCSHSCQPWLWDGNSKECSGQKSGTTHTQFTSRAVKPCHQVTSRAVEPCHQALDSSVGESDSAYGEACSMCTSWPLFQDVPGQRSGLTPKVTQHSSPFHLNPASPGSHPPGSLVWLCVFIRSALGHGPAWGDGRCLLSPGTSGYLHPKGCSDKDPAMGPPMSGPGQADCCTKIQLLATRSLPQGLLVEGRAI